jgi:multidrug efflux pump subunit AcrB
MSLTRLVLRRPVSAIIIIFGLIVFGVMSILSLPQELTPEMELPMLIVSTVYPGAGPEDVEKLVTREIEGAVGSLSNMKTVTSTSSENMSLLILSYNYGTNMDISYTDLKEQLDGIANRLPESARKPVIIEMNMNSMATVYLSVSSNMDSNLLYVVEDEIVPEFEKLATVADVTVSGGRENYIKVELLEEHMQQYGVAMSTITACVSTADFSIPAGSLDYGSQSLTVRSSVEYRTLEAIRNIPIPLQSGGVIRLSDLANIYESTRDASSVSRYNGQSNITLSIQKRQSSSAVDTSREVMRVLETLRADYPDINIDVIQDNSEIIVDSISSVGQTLILSVLISMAVLFLFLGDIKASLIVGSSMPVSLLVAFILIDMMGFTLNIVTMSSLVLGVGMMVDNSIVVLDSCFKLQTRDKSLMDAALEGTKFVMLSIVASTITTVVVFLPLATIQGISGQLFRPLGFTIIFSLTASLASAITLVPMFFVRFKPEEKRRAPAALLLKKTERAYGKLLRKLLKKKKTVFAVSMAFLAASLWFATQLNVELMPTIDEGIVSINVATRPGLKLEKVDEIMTSIENMVAEHPDVESYTLSASSSGGFSLGGGSTTGSMQAYLRDKPTMDTEQVVEQWRLETQDMLDCDIDIATTSSTSMSMAGSGVQVNLKSSDLELIKEASK